MYPLGALAVGKLIARRVPSKAAATRERGVWAGESKRTRRDKSVDLNEEIETFEMLIGTHCNPSESTEV